MTAAGAQAFQPALIIDMGGKFDRSFNEAAVNGAERFRARSGIAYRDFEIGDDEGQREIGIRSMSRRGADIIAVIGYQNAPALGRLAPQFPAQRYCLIDGGTTGDNIRSIRFKSAEAAYLAGVMAGLASHTARAGFIGGIDIPPVAALLRGFEAGLHRSRSDARLTIDWIGDSRTGNVAVWNNPARAADLARAQFAQGVDIVFAAAGASGIGALQAARDAGRLAVGVDSNQNGLFPGAVLTSVIKRVDIAVERCFEDARQDAWTPGTQELGLAEGGVDITIDADNQALVPPAMTAAIAEARADVIAGRSQPATPAP